MSPPDLTIAIATFNSAKLLPMVFSGLSRQKTTSFRYECVIIDGGSTDSTVLMAEEFGCKILTNPRTEPVYAKFIALTMCRTKYIMYLDHDEELKDEHSLAKKMAALKKPGVHTVLGSGYITPEGYPFINEYINEFGDPFSYFVYRLSKREGFFVPKIIHDYPVVHETPDTFFFSFKDVSSLPLIEVVAAGSTFDREHALSQAPALAETPALIPHIFYLLLGSGGLVALNKNDAILHYSADKMGPYIRKIRWRIMNNIYHRHDMGESGFSGRQKFGGKTIRLRKALFIPYSLLLLPSLIDAIMLAGSRRNYRYLIHTLLAFYTGFMISFHMILKILGRNPILRSYDGSREVGQSTAPGNK